MSNYPKFLISTNKNAAPGKVYIFHAQKPRFLGEILSFKSLDDLNKCKANPKKEFMCKIGDQLFVICMHTEAKGKIAGIFVVKFFDNPLCSSGQIDIEGLMNKTSEWLNAYYKI